MKSLLITGASGFVGRHLIPEAVAQGFSITATGRGARPSWLPFDIFWIDADLTAKDDIKLLGTRWWGVIHLAANSIPASYKNLQAARGSVEMISRLLDHVESGRFLYVSSCHVYGNARTPHVEDEPLAPSGAYGQAKMLGEEAALSASHLTVRIVRPFNHIGVGMPEALFIPTVVRRVLSAQKGDGVILSGKNSIRDFLDVRDIVRAYLEILSIDDPSPNIFNVCSGMPVSIQQFSETLMKAANRSGPIDFSDRARSEDDVDTNIGNPNRLLNKTPWRRKFSLEESVLKLIEHEVNSK